MKSESVLISCGISVRLKSLKSKPFSEDGHVLDSIVSVSVNPQFKNAVKDIVSDDDISTLMVKRCHV